MTRYDDSTMRRYVLGAATEDESAAIEQEYFDRLDVLDRVSAVEEDLIDEYLSARLAPADRVRFERHYLATPRHRTRVAVVRSLRSAAPEAPVERRRFSWRAWTASFDVMRSWTPIGQVAMAAAVLLLVAAGTWRLGRPAAVVPVAGTTPAPIAARQAEPPATPRGGPPPATADVPVTARPTVVALTLSPIAVRAAGDTATLTIPAGTDVVALHLEGDAPARNVKARAVVRTVAGTEQWRGEAASDSASATTARIEIPADRLPPDDYIVELSGTDASGREREQYRYFFRVRARSSRD